MTTGPEPASRFRASLLGLALGDALGELAQTSLERFSRPLPDILATARRFTWTDDTAMALGLAETLVADGAIDPERLGACFHRRWAAEPWRGYAGGPPTIFALVEKDGLSYGEATARVSAAQFGGQGSWGNGAPMRAAPLGLFYHDNCELTLASAAAARVTHLHPLAVEGALLIARAVDLALGLDPARALDTGAFLAALGPSVSLPEYRAKLELMSALLASGASDAEAARRLGTGIESLESVPFAVYSFLRHPSSFEDCLLCAGGNGGDADTVAAMACGISGAFLGEAALPQAWLAKLEEADYIAALAGALSARAAGAEMPGGFAIRTFAPDTAGREILQAESVRIIMGSDYYRRHVGYLRPSLGMIDFSALTAVETRLLDDEAEDVEEAELVEEDVVLVQRGELRAEMRRSGAWYHDNGEAVAGPRHIALGRHEWYVPFAEALARRFGHEVYLLDFLVWPDLRDPHGSLLWFMRSAEAIEINLRGITAADLHRATLGAGGSKAGRRELGLPFMTSWEMNQVFWDEALLGRATWRTGGSMTAAEARAALGPRVGLDRIVEDDPASGR